MWRKWIYKIHEWALFQMSADDAQRVGLYQAEQLEEAAAAIRAACAQRQEEQAKEWCVIVTHRETPERSSLQLVSYGEDERNARAHFKIQSPKGVVRLVRVVERWESI